MRVTEIVAVQQEILNQVVPEAREGFEHILSELSDVLSQVKRQVGYRGLYLILTAYRKQAESEIWG